MRFVFNISTIKEIDAATEQEAREKLQKEFTTTSTGKLKVECSDVYDSEDGTVLLKACSDDTYYKLTCPRGYGNCVRDPAYIKANYPDWYKELYGDKTPYEAAEKCRERAANDPDEVHYCYDDEDK